MSPDQCIGRELTAVIESVHLYGDHPHLLELWLDFGGLLLHVRGNGAGNQLEFDSTPVGADYSMGRYGRVASKDVSSTDRFKGLVGRRLASVDPIYANYQPGPIGFSLVFIGGSLLRLQNTGDELIVESEAP